jgi:hypothetical protein
MQMPSAPPYPVVVLVFPHAIGEIPISQVQFHVMQFSNNLRLHQPTLRKLLFESQLPLNHKELLM